MLLNFTVRNYRSFYDEVMLDFVIDKNRYSQKALDDNPYTVRITDDLYVSKVLLLYGHNASGKSNLFKALSYFLSLKIERLFDQNMIHGRDKDSYFEVQFIRNVPITLIDKVENTQDVYTYSILLNSSEDKIKTEILKKNDNLIFERQGNSVTDGIEVFKKIQGVPDRKSLFNHIKEVSYYSKDKQIEEVFSILVSISQYAQVKPFDKKNADVSIKISYPFLKVSNLLNSYDYFFKLADFGIDKIDLEKTDKNYTYNETDISNLNSNDSEVLKKSMIESVYNNKVVSERNNWIADFNEVESDGTKEYATHISRILLALRDNYLSIHDEIEGLQSELIEFMITLFKKDNFVDVHNSTSQILLSTHDTNLMEIEHILVDNIWFVNKVDNISEIYPASDNTDVTKENILETYKSNKLKGKYKSQAYAIPINLFSNASYKDN